MNKKNYTGIQSKTIAKTIDTLTADRHLLTEREVRRLGDKELHYIPVTMTLKTRIFAGSEQSLLDSETNILPRKGIVDFQNGVPVSEKGGGSYVVNQIRFGYASGFAIDDPDNAQNKAEDPAAKSYKQIYWPTDLENAVVVISQGSEIREFKLSNHVQHAVDYGMARSEEWEKLPRPMTIVRGVPVEITLKRPSGITGNALGAFMSIDMRSMQTFPVRRS